MYYFYFRRKTGNTVMIYKILDKEEIGELKEELSCGLPGTAKVYISSWFVFWTLGIHFYDFIHVQHRNNCSCRDKIYIFSDYVFQTWPGSQKEGEKITKSTCLFERRAWICWYCSLSFIQVSINVLCLFECSSVVINTFNKIWKCFVSTKVQWL